MRLVIYGVSDDLIEIEGDLRGEYDVSNRAAVLKLTSSEGKLMVFVMYAPKPINVPVWTIGISPMDEDEPIPQWPVKFVPAETGYGVALVLDCPNDLQIECVV